MFKRMAWAVVVLLPIASAARADDFFTVNASGGGNNVSVGGSSLLHLVDNLINERAQFTPLLGQNVTANLSYGGIPNALLFSENAAHTTATFTIPATGFTQTFNGTSAADLQSQIKNFIKQDGAGEYADFLKSINQNSAVAAIDGNPQAYTAFLANDAFDRFGLGSTQSTATLNGGDIGQFRADAHAGYVRAAGLDGAYAEVSLGTDVRFTNNVGLSFGTALQYRETAGSSTYFAAEEIGLPITLAVRDREGIAWQVTPWAFGGVGASTDQVAGAILIGGGGTSNLSLKAGDFLFTLGNQISYASGVHVAFDGYSYDTNVNQWIVKNGVKATYTPGNGPFFVDAGISYSDLLHRAAIPDYWTPEVGAGLKIGDFAGVKLDLGGNLARNYTDVGAQLTFFLSY